MVLINSGAAALAAEVVGILLDHSVTNSNTALKRTRSANAPTISAALNAANKS